ncbi:DUF2530 domain-containing protein [Bifidobacterium favimelis]|uniref:DUF2530 domain-containing protein n=1 Tax=Bifidobacterium favimelis TaxID=3122979 RepID=A0ABU8ZLY6_9BIFI
MKLAPIFNPDARRPSPKPVQVDLRKVFVTGTVLWVLALIVFGLLKYLGYCTVKPLIVSISGVCIGLILLIWEYFNRWDYRRLAR